MTAFPSGRPIGAASLFLALAAAHVLDAAPPAKSAPKPGERPLVFGVNRVGNPEPIFNPPDYTEHLYQCIREAGGTAVRLVASPRDIERQRGKRDWKDFDDDLALALKYGQESMVLICNTPAWASPTGKDTHEYPYKDECMGDFASFCAELARRTKGKVKYFQLWNEQNGCGWHFHDGFNHFDEYVPVLAVCYKAIKQGNAQAQLLMGSLDDAQGNGPIFMNGMYEERKKKFKGQKILDGFTDHPYSDDWRTMKKKLDALREIAEKNGEGNLPMWITEYGWHNDNTPEDRRAGRMRNFLAQFITPEWSFLHGAIYLSISDFEGGTTGFGLVDANLRPRPMFYEFQMASRFGAFPPGRIRWRPLAGDRAELAWETLQPTTGTVKLAPTPASPPPESKESGTSHRLEIGGLSPGTEYEVTITTKAKDGRTIASAPHVFRAASKEVGNGDFEGGFYAGIGRHWTIDGPAFCADAARVPDAPVRGKHAQAVVAHRGAPLDATARACALAGAGKDVTLEVSAAGEGRNTGAQPQARVGIDKAGGADPGAGSVVWGEWQGLEKGWGRLTATAKAEAAVVTVFIQTRTEGGVGGGMAYVVFDEVKVR
jgi:hypothetical protein